MDAGAISQMLRESKIQGNLRNHPLAGRLGLGGRHNSGFMMGAAEGSLAIPSYGQSGGAAAFDELVALAQSQAEMSGSSGAAGTDAAWMRVASLPGVSGPSRGGESRALDLVRQVNAEAILSSENFGNLQGINKSRIGLDTGRAFNKAEMNSWRHKNGFMREAPPEEAATGNPEAEAVPAAEAAEAAQQRREAGLKMPYGQIHAPRRPASDRGWTLRREAGTETAASTDSAPSLSAEKTAAVQAEPGVTAAQKDDAASSAAETVSFTRADLNRLVDRVGQALGLDSALIMAVIKTESNFDHQAVSRVGAKGLMQLMPGTAKDLGVEDPFNPVENVWGGARYLKQMLDRHGGNVDKALASYNWGPGNFARYQKKGGRMPNETRNYIVRVNKHYNAFKQESA